ncbi:MAG: glycosyltransferase, partial [Anaerolineae bacterium]|nr:glycosyltransferase [Anaerolineae bacterium]
LPLLCHLSWAASSLVEVRRVIAAGELDAVIGLTLTNSYCLALQLRQADIPFVNVVLEPYHTMMPEHWVRPLARRVEQLALRASDAVVVFTPQMRHYVCEMDAPPERVSTLQTGVSLDLFRPHVDGSIYRAELGIGEGEWVLFFMGWLYGFSGLRQIVGRLVDEPDLLGYARLLIVGDGDLYAELRRTVEQANMTERVILTGRRPYDQIPGLVAAGDVCLLPSEENDTTRDIVPMKVYEYLAAGKPVVACRLPGLLAEFGDSSGILYGDDPVDVVRRAVALAGHSAEVKRLGAAGRRTAEENADWEKTTERLEEILAAVAGVT